MKTDYDDLEAKRKYFQLAGFPQLDVSPIEMPEHAPGTWWHIAIGRSTKQLQMYVRHVSKDTLQAHLVAYYSKVGNVSIEPDAEATTLKVNGIVRATMIGNAALLE